MHGARAEFAETIPAPPDGVVAPNVGTGCAVVVSYDDKAIRGPAKKGKLQARLEKELGSELGARKHKIPIETFNLFEDLQLVEHADLQSAEVRSMIVWSLQECAPIFRGDELQLVFMWMVMIVLSDRILVYQWCQYCGSQDLKPRYVVVAWLAQELLRQWGQLATRQQTFLIEATQSLIMAQRPSSVHLHEVQVLFDPVRGYYVFVEQAIRIRDYQMALKFLRQTPSEQLRSQWLTPGSQSQDKTSFADFYYVFWQGADQKLLGEFVRLLASSFRQCADSLQSIVLGFIDKADVDNVCKLDFLVSTLSALHGEASLVHDDDEERPIRCCVVPRRRRPPQRCVIEDQELWSVSRDIEQVLFERLVDQVVALSKKRHGDFTAGDLTTDMQLMMEALLLLTRGDDLREYLQTLQEPRSSLAQLLLERVAAPHVASIVQNANNCKSYTYDDDVVQKFVDGFEVWAPDSIGSTYFYDVSMAKPRRCKDVSKLLLVYFRWDLALGGQSMGKFMRALEWDSDCLATCFNSVAPKNMALRTAICRELQRCFSYAGVMLPDLQHFMDYIGFFDAGTQSLLKSGALANAMGMGLSETVLASIMEALIKLESVHGLPRREGYLEDVMLDLARMCQSSNLSCEFVGKVSSQILKRSPADFLPESLFRGGTAGFGISNFQECARRLNVASEVIDIKMRSKRVGQGNLLKVVGGLIDSSLGAAPELWESYLGTLDTNVFFLEYMGKEDLGLAYAAFEKEFQDGAVGGTSGKDNATAQQLKSLLKVTESIYTEPLVHIDITRLADMKSMDIVAFINQHAKRLKSEVLWCGIAFTPDDWNDILEIVGVTCAAMQEKLSVPMLPHHTQMITLIMFAVRTCGVGVPCGLPMTMLARVGTGEGKSWIIGMLAAFVAKRGMRLKNGLRAHVVIDNPTLKSRDFDTVVKFFQRLNIPASKSEEHLLKPEYAIVYCTGAEIWAQCRHFQEKGQIDEFERSLQNAVLIVDEVDGLIIDGDANIQYMYRDDSMSYMADYWLRELENGATPEVPSHPEHDMSVEELQVVLDKVQSAYEKAYAAVEGKDYEWREGSMYMIDKSTGRLLEGWWDLWYEIRHWTETQWSYEATYKCTKSILCKSKCFTAYACIFGLTGSLGQKAEMEYLAQHYNACSFNVPCFLDTCRADDGQPQGKPVLRLLNDGDIMQPDEYTHIKKVVDLACAKYVEVPVIIVVKDQMMVDQVACQLCYAIGASWSEGAGGDQVIKLLQTPGKPEQFVKLVDLATRPWTVGDNQKVWRITVTTADGGRGHDYQVADPAVDEKGGLLLILMWVSWSQREWVQFLGRTARQDHEGQYAVYLNRQSEELTSLAAEGVELCSAHRVIGNILNAGNEKLTKKFAGVASHISRGSLMHKYTARYWQTKTSQPSTTQKQEDVWRKLCREYLSEGMPEAAISKEFEKSFPRAAVAKAVRAPVPSPQVSTRLLSKVRPLGAGVDDFDEPPASLAESLRNPVQLNPEFLGPSHQRQPKLESTKIQIVL